jgi:hypothetical protein
MAHELAPADAAGDEAIDQVILVLAASATQCIQSFEVDRHFAVSLLSLLTGVARSFNCTPPLTALFEATLRFSRQSIRAPSVIEAQIEPRMWRRSN